MEKTTPNIYDIARQAGVSIATVSRVLGGGAHVRPETRRKVMEVVEKTGYTPNAFARGLGLGTMKMVGILCTDLEDLFCARAVSILERLLRQSGLDTLLYCTGHWLQNKKRYIDHLLAKHVDAVLLVGSAFKERDNNAHIEQAATQVPVVIINGLVECAGVYCVLCNEFSAMRDNVARLHRDGCRHIVYLYDAETYSGMQKLAGYRKGLADCGLEEQPGWVVRCEPGLVSAREAVANMPQVDAVLASEDILAIGACKALEQGGRRAAVIGFNNSVLARCATPSLTSVDNMVESMCHSAVNILDRLLAQQAGVPPKIVIDPVLVERETYPIQIK